MSNMLDICKKIRTRERESRDIQRPETVEMQTEAKLIEEFKKSDTFIKCCDAMIAHEVLIHIRQNNKHPTDGDLREMASMAKQLDRQFQEWHNNPNLGTIEKIQYNVAKAMRQKNKDYKTEAIEHRRE